MKLNNLYEAIRLLGPQEYYYLNDANKLDTYMLEYNRKMKTWEYYFLNERGGKSYFEIFTTEKEACAYVFKEALESIKTSTHMWMDAVKEEYETITMNINDLNSAIKKLGEQEYYFLNDRIKASTYVLEYNKEKHLWEYYLIKESGEKDYLKTFATEPEACQYVLNDAIVIIKTLKDEWMDAVKRKYEAID